MDTFASSSATTMLAAADSSIGEATAASVDGLAGSEVADEARLTLSRPTADVDDSDPDPMMGDGQWQAAAAAVSPAPKPAWAAPFDRASVTQSPTAWLASKLLVRRAYEASNGEFDESLEQMGLLQSLRDELADESDVNSEALCRIQQVREEQQRQLEAGLPLNAEQWAQLARKRQAAVRRREKRRLQREQEDERVLAERLHDYEDDTMAEPTADSESDMAVSSVVDQVASGQLEISESTDGLMEEGVRAAEMGR
jgi:hypothetical protein